MAVSNREWVGRVLESLREGLGPFIVREYRSVYSGQGYVNEIEGVLATPGYRALPDVAWADEQALLDGLDVQACLNLMWRRWNDVFGDKLGHSGRSYASELMTFRNAWAHQEPFSNDEAYRAADTAARLLKMVGAPREANAVGDIARRLLRERFDRERDRSTEGTTTDAPGASGRGAGRMAPMEKTTPAGLRAWREVVQPHPDVASGRYVQAEFAADLSQVLAGTAEREYQDPLEFFRRTYLTESRSDIPDARCGGT